MLRSFRTAPPALRVALLRGGLLRSIGVLRAWCACGRRGGIDLAAVLQLVLPVDDHDIAGIQSSAEPNAIRRR